MWQDKEKASCLGRNPANYNLPYLWNRLKLRQLLTFYRCCGSTYFRSLWFSKGLQRDFILKKMKARLWMKAEKKTCYRCDIGQC